MGAISQKMKRTENFRNYINKILRNQEIDCDEEWWNREDAWSELQKLAGAERNYVTDSIKLNIEGREKLIAAVFWQDPDELYKIVAERVEELIKEEDVSGIQLVFFVRDMKSRIGLEKAFDTKTVTRLRAMARKRSGNRELGIHCIYILQKEYDSQEVKLKGLRRHEMMQMPPIEGKINQERADTYEEIGEKINALVFTVELYQLAGLYNLIGDRLFKNNVRFGISETLGVDHSIQKTLETEPELFWFKNNGVTILVESSDFMPRNVEELKLDEIGPEKEPEFSVVNGAQTITTAAKYFFNMEYNWQNSSEGTKEKADFLKKLNRSKKAQVILRIIQITGGEKAAEVSNTAKDISVALNRQKPIKMEDIAFTLQFVEKLTRYLERTYEGNQEQFLLVRRGEESAAGQEMDLVEFARTRLACIGQPGGARSQGSKTLLKIRTEDGTEDTFQRKDIFVPEWADADETEETAIFRRHYGAVWFGHKIAEEYDRQRKAVAKDTKNDCSTVINNGKWYFTAIVVQLLNGLTADPGADSRKLYDFSRFGGLFSSVREKIAEAMNCFARMVVFYIQRKGEYGELDSNLFKKDELYRGLMEEIIHVFTSAAERETELGREIWKFAQLLAVAEAVMARTEAAAAIETAEVLETGLRVPEAGDNMPETGKRSEAVKMDFLILNGKKYPCKKLAQAQADTVNYILKNYNVTEEQLKAVSGWITDKREVGEGKGKYFRNVKTIRVNGKDYWVGTSSNLDTKCNQARTLCETVRVGKNEIFWYADSLETPVFSW